jgi:two-component system sensor histidine kinase ChvG
LLAIIAQDVGRLDRLVTDMARASRLEAETARGAIARVDLGRLLAELSDTYGQTRREAEAVVSFKGPPPAGAIVIGQEGPLGQVFRNLIDNAKSFSPPHGVVTVEVAVTARRDGRMVRATVSDQGPGILPANLESVFQRFYTDRPKGVAFGGNSGLGLSIARQIVEAYKGRIWAENIDGVAPDDRLGARFIVELPLAET